MNPRLRSLLLLAAFPAFGCTPDPVPDDEVPLDVFVADDTGFAFETVWAETSGGFDTFLLDVTSGTWRSAEEVDRTTWRHDVILAVPHGAPTDTALVIVVGGSERGDSPEPGGDAVALAELVALMAHTPVVGVSQIPSQPLTILGEAGERTEDDLVAASWHKVLETGDPTWSAYFPMTRGVVRAMDAVQAQMADRGTPVEDFVVTGFSKRGATTYLVGAVDQRVVAMAPGVFDFLDFRPQARHHMDVYGEPAPAVRPYAEYDLLERVHLEEAEPLIQTSDPFVYRDRFTMPKLIIASPGDQFFLPDAMRFYIDHIPGETLVRYVPNTGHDLAPEGGDATEVLEATIAWYRDIVAGDARPSLSWSHAAGRLTVTADPVPGQVRLWSATNPEGRNFRFDVIGAAWEAETLAAEGDGTFVAEVPEPEAGHTAYLVEATFGGGQVYTTQVYVTPDD